MRFTFQDAIEIVASRPHHDLTGPQAGRDGSATPRPSPAPAGAVDRPLRWARNDPPWSGPSPSEVDNYGTLYAFPAAHLGEWSLYHDKARRHFARTVEQAPSLPFAVAMSGRLWRVERGPRETV